MRISFSAVSVAVVLAFPAAVNAQSLDLDRAALEQRKHLALRSPRVDTSALSNIYDQNLGTGNYKIRLGVYGAYDPSIFPTETWVQIACMSEPGRSYPGTFDLVTIHILLYSNGQIVWDTRINNRDTGVCAVGRGVDYTFIEVPRSLTFDSADPFIRYDEMTSKGVSYSKEIYPVHRY